MRLSLQQGFDFLYESLESLSKLALKHNGLINGMQEQLNAQTRRSDDLQRQINDLVMERNSDRQARRNNTPG